MRPENWPPHTQGDVFQMEEAAIERHNLGYSLREPAEGDLDLEPEMDPGATSSIGGPDQAESSTTDSDLGMCRFFDFTRVFSEEFLGPISFY